MRVIIAEAKLVQSPVSTNLFYFDNKECNVYLNLDADPEMARILKPYVGQTLTISVEIEQLCCCYPDFEKRVLRIIQSVIEKHLKNELKQRRMKC